MDMTELASMTKRELDRIGNDLNKHAAAQKERVSTLDQKTGELQARLLDVEQRVHRRGSEGDSGHGSYARSAFSAAAEDLLAGIRGANSSRVALAIGIKAALHDADHALPPENLGAVSVYTPAIARLVDLLPARPVSANTLTYIRVDYDVTDSPPVGNQAAKVQELQAKPQSSLAAVPITVEVSTFAHWIETGKQILDDVDELKAILDGILRGGLLDVVDADVFAVLTTALNYTTFTPVASETVGDAVARIAAQIASAGGTNIVVALNPTDYLTMQLTKASTAGSYLGIPPNLASRVVSAPAVTQSKILAFAPGSGAGWADREGVNLVMGLRNDQFTRNAVTLLCEARGETMIRNPAHVAYGDVTTA